MKIALIFFRIVHAGGLERRLLNYMNWFLSEGHHVTIIHAKRDHSIEIPKEVELKKIQLRWVPKPLRMAYFSSSLPRAMRNDEFDLTLSLGRTAGQELLICPGTHRGYLASQGKRKGNLIDRLTTRLDSRAFKKSAHILAASKMMEEELITLYGVDPGKISVLYPPCNTDRFNQSLRARRESLRQQFGFEKEEKICLFVSYSHPRKGLPLLLEVFRKLGKGPFKLIICGNTPKTPLPPNVKYLGFMHQMPELYTAADLTIHPAGYEPFGQIVTESLQCGTPVLVSDKTGAAELVNRTEGRVVTGFNPDDWQNAIIEIAGKNLSIKEGFAVKNGLTLDTHMAKMMTCHYQLKHKA